MLNYKINKIDYINIIQIQFVFDTMETFIFREKIIE